jgi:hypothetical protein
MQHSQSCACLKPKGYQALLYSFLGKVKGCSHKILLRFWDNKLQFWPERLHIAGYSPGLNERFSVFLVDVCLLFSFIVVFSSTNICLHLVSMTVGYTYQTVSQILVYRCPPPLVGNADPILCANNI